MEVQQDFRDLLALFNKHEVDYIIVGAYALAFHGAPRYTGDLDILVKPETANARSIVQALNEFGFGSVGLTEGDFEQGGRVVQLGYPPVRVDIITSITGVSWEQARSGRMQGQFGDLPVPYIGREDLVAKKPSGRTEPNDLPPNPHGAHGVRDRGGADTHAGRIHPRCAWRSRRSQPSKLDTRSLRSPTPPGRSMRSQDTRHAHAWPQLAFSSRAGSPWLVNCVESGATTSRASARCSPSTFRTTGT